MSCQSSEEIHRLPAILFRTPTQVNAQGLLRLPRALYGGKFIRPQQILEAGVGGRFYSFGGDAFVPSTCART